MHNPARSKRSTLGAAVNGAAAGVAVVTVAILSAWLYFILQGYRPLRHLPNIILGAIKQHEQ
jgi:hypothetical protein